MANTKSARSPARRATRRTVINKVRRTNVRSSVREVETAIKSGDKTAAIEALKAAEPALMRGARRGVLHKKTASRKVSRLAHQIAKLGK